MSSEPLHEAYRMIREGNKEEARRLLVPFVRADPLNADAWWLLANALEDPDKQRRALERVLNLRPDDEKAHRMFNRLQFESPASAPASKGKAALPPADDMMAAMPEAIELDPTAVFQSDDDDDLFPVEEIRVHKSRGSGVVTIILAIVGLFTIASCALCILTLTISAPVISKVVGEVVLTVTAMPGIAPLMQFITPEPPTLPGTVKISGSIEAGETVQGMVDASQDAGWTFSADAGERVIIDLNAVDNAFDPKLVLYAPNGLQIAENDDVDGANNRNSRIAITLPDGGRYTIRVRPYSGGGAYELTLTQAE